MELSDAIRTRRSVRKYNPNSFEEKKLHAVLEAVRVSPSWANMQCWRILVVREKETKQKISELSYVESFFAPKGYKANPAQKALAEAPVVIALCADPLQSGTLWDQSYYLVDTGIAAQSLMLTARDQGLGTVFVGVFQEEKIRELLHIPPSIRVVGLFPLGYPSEDKQGGGPARKPLAEICFYERWGAGRSAG